MKILMAKHNLNVQNVSICKNGQTKIKKYIQKIFQYSVHLLKYKEQKDYIL